MTNSPDVRRGPATGQPSTDVASNRTLTDTIPRPTVNVPAGVVRERRR